MKQTRILFLFLLLSNVSFAADLPVRVFNSANKSRPLIFYISGDGGWNNFSTSLVQGFIQQGFPVIGLDAKAYFWDRKTPEQATQEIAALLMQYNNLWKGTGIVFIGYSFGADVVPFIQTRLPVSVVQHVSNTLLLSPSERTDFEVHVLDLFTSSSHSFNVMAEINKWNKPVTVFFGADEDSNYKKALTSKTARVVVLAGGHHYSSNMPLLTKELLASMGF